MTNQEVAALFLELADLLDLAGELPFKSSSYRKIAASLENLSEPFGKIISNGESAKIDGAGKAIREKLTVLAVTGKFPALDKWRNHDIAKFRELLERFPVKPRPLGTLIRKLGARNIDDFTAKIEAANLENFTGQVRETALKIKEVIPNEKC
jgi:DNA polymerase (family 10)